MSGGRIETAAGNAEMAAAWDGDEGDHWAEHAAIYEGANARFMAVLLDAVDVGATGSALDIGCGTGATARAIGRRAPDGSVLGVDLSAQMLAVGRAAAAAEGLHHVTFEQADAQVHPFEPATFDVAISSFGAMFFADPVAAFANIRSGMRPGATLALMAWRDLERNEWIREVRGALAAGRDLPVPPPGVPSPFSLADRELTTERLAEAGLVGVSLASVDEPVCLGRDLEEAWTFASTFGLTRGLTADLDGAARDQALDRLRQSLARHETPDGVFYGASAWLITAEVPS